MASLDLPEYDKYLRYAAYKNLYDVVLDRVQLRKVNRVSVNVICSLLPDCVEDVIGAVEVLTPHLTDDFETLVAKRSAYLLFDTYAEFVEEAAGAYASAFVGRDRLTISSIVKVLKPVLDEVSNDLLML